MADELEALAASVAVATQETVVVGCRPKGGDVVWFAACGDVSWEGSTPFEALRSVAESVARESRAGTRSAQIEAERLAAVADGVDEALAAAPVSPTGGDDDGGDVGGGR